MSGVRRRAAALVTTALAVTVLAGCTPTVAVSGDQVDAIIAAYEDARGAAPEAPDAAIAIAAEAVCEKLEAGDAYSAAIGEAIGRMKATYPDVARDTGISIAVAAIGVVCPAYEQ